MTLGSFWVYSLFKENINLYYRSFSFSEATPFRVSGGPERTEMFCVCPHDGFHVLSPRIRLANWMSFGIMVTRRAWIAHELPSSNRPTK